VESFHGELAAAIGDADRRLVDRLFPPFPEGIQWGLERTHRILERVGDPHSTYPVLHVGGTNGKGSVAATLASVLSRAGFRVGLYTSPHLRSFRERFQVGGVPLSEEVLQAAADQLRPGLTAEGATFFEAATVLAFTAFRDVEVQVAVVEVGLGGRLDSTNVVTPLVTGITNVAMDHSEYLGGSVVSIAGEKAGILKAGVPSVTAELDPEILEVLHSRAIAVGSELTALPEDHVKDVSVGTESTSLTLEGTGWGKLEVTTPLPGAHQARNVALAVGMLDRLPEALRPDRAVLIEGVRRTRWPGRVQILKRPEGTWVFDVGHNVAGVAALVATLDAVAVARPLVILVGILGDKDWPSMLPPLFELADHVVLTQPPTAPPTRRWSPEDASSQVGGSTPQEIVLDFGQALARAREVAGEGTVVVTGSVHTVGDALEVLNIDPFPAEGTR